MGDAGAGGDIVIDGSHGEGGGQILRTAVALSAITGRSVRVDNIRAGRPKPGLMAQHLTSIRAVGLLCSAQIDGDSVGSTRVLFTPSIVKAGKLDVDVGTAGSVSLVLQSCLLGLARSAEDSYLIVRGGTDVKMAPPLSYYELVLFPILRSMGLAADIIEMRRGFYPEGGGMCKVRFKGSRGHAGLELNERGMFLGIEGVAFSQNLPEHVVSRMASEAKKVLVKDQPVRMRQERGEGLSTGAGTVLSARYERTVIGASCLGEQGLRSERVAQLAATELQRSMASTCTLDVHAADQLLPYMALAAGPSTFIVDEVTPHLQTQIGLVKMFLDVEIKVSGQGPFLIDVVPNRT